MSWTHRQQAETASRQTPIGGFRAGLGAAATLVFCFATCAAAEDAPTKPEKSDAAATSQKSSGTPSKDAPSAKGEKSWGSDSYAPKQTAHRPRPNVNLKDSAAV